MIPEKFVKRTEWLFCSRSEHNEFIKALESKEAVRALRVNSLKMTEADFADRTSLNTEKLEFCTGYRFWEDKIGADPLHHAGAYYVQDPSAMCAVAAAKEYIKPDHAVLDMCAAPGGKSTQAASLITGDKGYLVSNEIDRGRARILRSNTERMGHRRTVVTGTDPMRLAEDFPHCFDMVIVDAPCSGEGMFRKYAEAAEEWSEENVLMCAERQRMILSAAARCVAPGGYLMYSTCTFSLEENEENVDSFLCSHGEFGIVPVSAGVKNATADGIVLRGREELKECRRFYPHLSWGEGQFICIMKRDDSGERGAFRGKSGAVPLSKAERSVVAAFLADNTENTDVNDAVMLRNTVMLAKDLPCPEYALCCGVAAGEVTKGRFEPHHHLFSACGKNFVRRIQLECGSEEASAYLRGETVSVDGANTGNGWCAVLVDGCPVGGGKIVGNTMKNHYPKGLRTRK